jgi:hypothetical protein
MSEVGVIISSGVYLGALWRQRMARIRETWSGALRERMPACFDVDAESGNGDIWPVLVQALWEIMQRTELEPDSMLLHY